MSDPIQSIARHLGIQTFGDGLLAKIGQTIDLLQEAARNRADLAAECERLREETAVLLGDIAELEVRRDAALAELAALKGGQVRYMCHACHAYTPPPKPYRAFVSCEKCGEETAATRALCTASPAQASAWPEGWKLVPVELTPEMLREYERHAIAPIGPISIYGYRAMLAAAPNARAEREWVPVSEQLPESERAVLAYYLNSHGKGRRIRAEYIAPKTKGADDGWDWDCPADYDEATDQSYWPAGWYEVMDNWDGLTHVAVVESEVTHWMPLPTAPAAARQEGGKA